MFSAFLWRAFQDRSYSFAKYGTTQSREWDRIPKKNLAFDQSTAAINSGNLPHLFIIERVTKNS